MEMGNFYFDCGAWCINSPPSFFFKIKVINFSQNRLKTKSEKHNFSCNRMNFLDDLDLIKNPKEKFINLF